MRKWLDKYALFAAIIVGAIGFPLFKPLTPALPYLLFGMLFFTFCKVDPKSLRFTPWHGWALLLQIGWAVLSYLIVTGLAMVLPILSDPAIAQSVMLCFLMPSATAAPIIAGKLGGSIQDLTTYTLLTNLLTAVIVPFLFPFVNTELDMVFWQAFWLILRRVAPVLLGPLVTAWIIRFAYNAIQQHKGSGKVFALSTTWAQMPFYLWVGTILILMGDITYTLIHSSYSGWSALFICLGAALSCFLQFRMGHRVGFRCPSPICEKDYHDVVINPKRAPHTPQGVSFVTAGQALGQKNTTLAIWLADTYLHPLAALGPAVYMIVQNFYNSSQLRRAAK